jgi:hypothetical protein
MIVAAWNGFDNFDTHRISISFLLTFWVEMRQCSSFLGYNFKTKSS